MAQHDARTPAWITFGSIPCGNAASMAAVGIVYLPLDLWMWSYMPMAALFPVHASISSTHMLRERHETNRPAAPEFRP